MNSSNQSQVQPPSAIYQQDGGPALPAGYAALSWSTPLPGTEGRAIVYAIAPTLEVGILIYGGGQAQGDDQAQQEAPLFFGADATITALDYVTSQVTQLLPHLSPEFLRTSDERIQRVRAASVALEARRTLQLALAELEGAKLAQAYAEGIYKRFARQGGPQEEGPERRIVKNGDGDGNER